jgi:hypothetical protein
MEARLFFRAVGPEAPEINQRSHRNFKGSLGLFTDFSTFLEHLKEFRAEAKAVLDGLAIEA